MSQQPLTLECVYSFKARGVFVERYDSFNWRHSKDSRAIAAASGSPDIA